MPAKFIPCLALGSVLLLASCKKDDVDPPEETENTGTQIHMLVELGSFVSAADVRDTSNVYVFDYDAQGRLSSMNSKAYYNLDNRLYEFQYNGTHVKPWKMIETLTTVLGPQSRIHTHFLSYDGKYVQKDSIVSSLGTYWVQESVPMGSSFQLNFRGTMFPSRPSLTEVLTYSDNKLTESNIQAIGQIYTATYLASQNPLAELLPEFEGQLYMPWDIHAIALTENLVQKETHAMSFATYDTRLHTYQFRADGYPLVRTTAGNDDFRRLYYFYQ